MAAKAICILECMAHASILVAPIFITEILHNSDSLWTHIPETTVVDDNITKIGFGVKYFQIGNATDIEFSEGQRDVVDHETAHTVYHVFETLMVVGMVLPLLVTLNRLYMNEMNALEVKSKLSKSLATVYIPWIALCMILNVSLTMWLMASQSSLCTGNAYMELGYERVYEEDSSSSLDSWDDDGSGCHYEEWMGTFALPHPDIKASCQLRRGGVGAISGVLVWTLVMTLQVCVLYYRSNQWNHQLQLAKATETIDPVLSITNKHSAASDEEEDATVATAKVEEGLIEEEEEYVDSYDRFVGM